MTGPAHREAVLADPGFGEGIEAICQHLYRAIEIADDLKLPALRYFLAMAAMEAATYQPPIATELMRLIYPEG